MTYTETGTVEVLEAAILKKNPVRNRPPLNSFSKEWIGASLDGELLSPRTYVCYTSSVAYLSMSAAYRFEGSAAPSSVSSAPREYIRKEEMTVVKLKRNNGILTEFVAYDLSPNRAHIDWHACRHHTSLIGEPVWPAVRLLVDETVVAPWASLPRSAGE